MADHSPTRQAKRKESQMATEKTQWTDKDAAKLKKDRAARGVTQAEFAEKAGIKRARYSFIEYKTTSKGVRVRPNAEELDAITWAIAALPKAKKAPRGKAVTRTVEIPSQGEEAQHDEARGDGGDLP
jgi:transcriptional regulator with XRE-family HTH domain